MHLVAFESTAWDGLWWETLRWRILAGFPLGPVDRARPLE